MDDEEYLTISDVAKKFHISEQTAYIWAKKGTFPVLRVEGRVLVPKKAFSKWSEKCTTVKDRIVEVPTIQAKRDRFYNIEA